MTIGLVDVDGKHFPNLAIMKLSAYLKAQGHKVEWAKPIDLFEQVHYDRIYASKVFSFTPDINRNDYIADEWIVGGTGYDVHSELPYEIEHCVPDYDLYNLPKNVAYGFLTRGCPNKCKWCIVPKKEGLIHAHADIEEIAVDGRNNVTLMDNNVLACKHGLAQIEKMGSMNIWVDFNQGLDARLVTPEIADLLARLKWIDQIRFGCDTPKQVEECNRAVELLNERGVKKNYLFYTMLYGDVHECYDRLMFWHNKGTRYNVQAQPYIDLNAPTRKPPQWQKDMARWGNQKVAFHSCDFKDYSPRKGFKCGFYLK